MAKRDFAKVHSPAKKKPHGKNGIPAAMAAVSLLLTAVVGFSGGYMTGEQQNAPQKLKSENNELKQKLTEQSKQLDSLNKQLQSLNSEQHKTQAKPHPNATQQVGDLTFYSSLPKQKVMPAPLGDSASAVAGKTAHRTSPQVHQNASDMAEYRLQLGSYIRRSDAEGFVNRMLKWGLAAQVNEKTVEGVGVRYRVLMGPFNGLAAAEAARSDAREKLHVDGLLLREQ